MVCLFFVEKVSIFVLSEMPPWVSHSSPEANVGDGQLLVEQILG